MLSQATNSPVFDPSEIARTSMLRLARSWESRGQINQAIDTFSRILSAYPDSAEAHSAAEEILTLAQRYEQQGHYHLALSLYQRLEQLK